jgi:hypothetical protein
MGPCLSSRSSPCPGSTTRSAIGSDGDPVSTEGSFHGPSSGMARSTSVILRSPMSSSPTNGRPCGAQRAERPWGEALWRSQTGVSPRLGCSLTASSATMTWSTSSGFCRTARPRRCSRRCPTGAQRRRVGLSKRSRTSPTRSSPYRSHLPADTCCGRANCLQHGQTRSCDGCRQGRTRPSEPAFRDTAARRFGAACAEASLRQRIRFRCERNRRHADGDRETPGSARRRGGRSRRR